LGKIENINFYCGFKISQDIIFIAPQNKIQPKYKAVYDNHPENAKLHSILNNIINTSRLGEKLRAGKKF